LTLRSLVTGLRLSALSLALLLCAATARGDDFPVGSAGGALAGFYPNPTLAVVNSNVGTFGDASHVGQFTVTAGGQITAASGLSISIANANLVAGAYGNITGVGTLTAGSLGTGFTLNLSLPTYSGTLPAANVAPSATNGWVLTTTGGVTGWAPNAASTITWANDLAGSTNSSQTVVSISGATPIKITPNNLQWVAAATGPTISQATPTSDVAPANLLIQSQSPYASAVTNISAGSIILNLPETLAHPRTSPSVISYQYGGNEYASFGLGQTGLTGQATFSLDATCLGNSLIALAFVANNAGQNVTFTSPSVIFSSTLITWRDDSGTAWQTTSPAAAYVDQYAAGVTSANINFAADATASGTAAPLLIGAQNETGTGVTVGGALTLYTGSGTGNGIMHLKHGGSAGTDSLTLSQTGFAAFPAYGTGLAHFDSGGNITSSGVVNADLTAGSFTSITGVGALAAGSLAAGFTVVTAPLGGTGVASPTAHGTLVAEGASPATPIAPGAAGLYFRSNGASADPSFQAGPTWTTKTYCASGCTGTSGSTFTCPTPGNMTVCGTAGGGGGGGGGNGGSAVANNAAGGGAGGGGSLYSCQQVVCTPGGTETATYGAGGTGGGVAQSGNPGGPTYLIDSVLGVIAEWRGASGGSGGPTVIPSTGASDLCYAAGGGNVTINGGNSLAMCAASPIPAMSPGQGGAGGLAGNAPSIGSFTIALGQPGADSAFIPLSSIFGFTGGFGGAAGATSGAASGTYDGGSSGGGGGGGALGGNGGVGGVGGNGGAVTGNAGGACGATPAGIGSGGGGGGGAGSGGTSGGSGASGCAGTAGAILATWPN